MRSASPSISALLPTPASPTPPGCFYGGGRECRSSGRFRGAAQYRVKPAVTGVCGHVFGKRASRVSEASVIVPAPLPSAPARLIPPTPVSTAQSPVADGTVNAGQQPGGSRRYITQRRSSRASSNTPPRSSLCCISADPAASPL